jgi:hypothetical protein
LQRGIIRLAVRQNLTEELACFVVKLRRLVKLHMQVDYSGFGQLSA